MWVTLPGCHSTVIWFSVFLGWGIVDTVLFFFSGIENTTRFTFNNYRSHTTYVG